MTSVVEWSKAQVDPGSHPATSKLIFFFFLFLLIYFFLAFNFSRHGGLFSLVCFSANALQRVPCVGLISLPGAILDFYDR